jgi:hypothetical protein
MRTVASTTPCSTLMAAPSVPALLEARSSGTSPRTPTLAGPPSEGRGHRRGHGNGDCPCVYPPLDEGPNRERGHCRQQEDQRYAWTPPFRCARSRTPQIDLKTRDPSSVGERKGNLRTVRLVSSPDPATAPLSISASAPQRWQLTRCPPAPRWQWSEDNFSDCSHTTRMSERPQLGIMPSCFVDLPPPPSAVRRPEAERPGYCQSVDEGR